MTLSQRWELKLGTRTRVALESHFYRLQTRPEMTPDLTRLQEKDSWIFEKQLESLILKYLLLIFKRRTASAPQHPSASRNSSTILSEQRVKTAERMT